MDSYQGWFRDNILTNHLVAYLILEGMILYVDLIKEFALMLLIPILFIFAYTFYKSNRKQFIYYKLKERAIRKKAYLKKKSTFRTNTSYEIKLELELIDNKKIYKWDDIWAVNAHDKERLDYFFEFGIWNLGITFYYNID